MKIWTKASAACPPSFRLCSPQGCNTSAHRHKDCEWGASANGNPGCPKVNTGRAAKGQAQAFRRFRTSRRALNVLFVRAQDLTERKACAWPLAARPRWWNCVQPGLPLTEAGVPAIILSVHARIRCQRQPVQTGIARELNGISRQPRWSSRYVFSPPSLMQRGGFLFWTCPRHVLVADRARKEFEEV